METNLGAKPKTLIRACTNLLHLTILLFLFFFGTVVYAQEENSSPSPQIQLAVDRTSLNTGESVQAVLVLRNTTPYTLSNITAQLQGTSFNVVNSIDLPDTLSPYTSAQAVYTLQSQNAGSQNLIFAVQYSWDNPDTGTTSQWVETVSVEKIEVISPFAFRWPDYLIPLVIGAFLGQFIAWFTDRQKERRENRQREEQARGITLAMLQGARKGVEAQGQVSFNLWEEAIVKGNLYPALHQLGRKLGKPELSKRLAELSITLADYNERRTKENLTGSFLTYLIDDLTVLIAILENTT